MLYKDGWDYFELARSVVHWWLCARSGFVLKAALKTPFL
jgi:hypothetical protein